MTQPSPIAANPAGNLFGIPLGKMGWFASLLMAVAAGFMAFFASTFCAIICILLANTAAHKSIDYALSYRRIGFPIGLSVMAVALAYMSTLWIKRITRRVS
ncbi:MAG TPA: hypothetical protein VGU46_05110 [Acidobacteriaceae bacterium]|nr:hypothetical protein [Acidobacteriaceae bacterium]